MTGRDSYKGIPKTAAVRMDQDGNLETVVKGGFQSVYTCSGTLVIGGTHVHTPFNLGWHDQVFVSTVSGSKTSAIQHSFVPGGNTVQLSGADSADDRKFNLMVVRHGLGSDTH